MDKGRDSSSCKNESSAFLSLSLSDTSSFNFLDESDSALECSSLNTTHTSEQLGASVFGAGTTPPLTGVGNLKTAAGPSQVDRICSRGCRECCTCRPEKEKEQAAPARSTSTEPNMPALAAPKPEPQPKIEPVVHKPTEPPTKKKNDEKVLSRRQSEKLDLSKKSETGKKGTEVSVTAGGSTETEVVGEAVKSRGGMVGKLLGAMGRNHKHSKPAKASNPTPAATPTDVTSQTIPDSGKGRHKGRGRVSSSSSNEK